MDQNRIKIIVADDHAIFRQALKRRLEDEQGFNVIGLASDGHIAVDLARELTPNVVLMDVSMPALNGIEATRAVLRESPGTRVIALSMHSAKRYVREMFRAGASGYLLKDCEFDELVQAIRLIADGQTYISPSISRIVVENYTHSGTDEKESAFSVLTQQEREVLQLMAEGNSTKQIAMKLFISPKTVEAHRLRIMNKLDIDNVALLTKYAIQEGLTLPEPDLKGIRVSIDPSNPEDVTGRQALQTQQSLPDTSDSAYLPDDALKPLAKTEVPMTYPSTSANEPVRNGSMSIRIILADDHAILRAGLTRILQDERDFEVVGQAGDGHSTIELARELLPDIVLMDISMPDLNGIEATREIQREAPGVRVIALSIHSAKRYIIEMFRAGASGYLLKDCDFDELARAVRSVADGKTYVSPSISNVVVEDLVHTEEHSEMTAFSLLTQQEREVLQLLAEGRTKNQIALRLHISPKTVEAHRLRVMNKLEIDNVAQLTKYAIQEGLTSAEP